MRRLFIGIGSNVGDRHLNLLDAINRIASLLEVTARSVSSIYETEPIGGPPQEWFLNCVLEAASSSPARNLLGALKAIEKTMGRKESPRHGPRIIDLDILLYGDLVINEKVLTIPHARLQERAFILIPLLEIDENLILPSLHRSLKELLADLEEDHTVRFYTKSPAFPYNDGHLETPL